MSGRQNTWVGGYRVVDGKNDWAWFDGTPWDYTSWQSGEPNDENKNEDFVGLYYWSGNWNDFSKDWKWSFICQYYKPAPGK